MMRVRLRSDIRFRRDDFGGVCYIPHRDDFFALTPHAFEILSTLPREYEPPRIQPSELGPFLRLGIAETEGAQDKEQPYSGPSFIGRFLELPTVSAPLVINCFTTAWCPLKCKYCHADDLMTREDRRGERDDFIDNVIATAQAVPALVAVITGGDPITRPDRAIRLIEGLSGSKALVLDTSGVGDVRPILPSLTKHGVHVRVSIDSALRSVNDKLRPVNTAVAGTKRSSWECSRATIQELVAANIAVSVQTVVTSQNDRLEDWRDLRDQLISWGVKHWVIHVVVAGGKARATERAAAGQKRPRSIRPSKDIGRRLAGLVHETMSQAMPIDIRCTDTDDRPNSVLLVASNGDLYTEGFAKKGKVRLFEAGAGRPDKIQALMAHLDRFGHARRYLNWNPWFAGETESLEDVCIPFPEPINDNPAVVETEFKLKIDDVAATIDALLCAGFVIHGKHLQRDEYFDTDHRFAARNDYVVRLRAIDDQHVEAAFKGPRFYSEDNASSRLEFEVPTTSIDQARSALLARGLRPTWVLEKKRIELFHKGMGVKAAIDELPLLGSFLELEGTLPALRTLMLDSIGSLGTVERRNYKELAEEEMSALGIQNCEGLWF